MVYTWYWKTLTSLVLYTRYTVVNFNIHPLIAISSDIFVGFTSNFQSILLRKCKKGRFETRKQGLNPQHFTMFLVLVIYKTFEDIIAKRKTIELKTNYHDYRFLKDWPRFYPDNGRYLVSTGGTSSSKDALLSGVTQRTTQAR